MSFADISLLLVFIVSSLSIILLTPVAKKMGLVDVPNHRKMHVGHIPLIGGISIYTGLLIGISLYLRPDQASLTFLVCSSILVILGIADDAKDISPKFRLFIQGAVALFMCLGSGLYIHNLGNIFGIGNFDLGVLGYPVTILAVIAAINAFNMVDGIDGLLGISSLITFVSMGILFSVNSDTENMKLTLIMSVALIPYLLANLELSPIKQIKIFMGDTGSMLIGFTVVWLLIQGTQATSETTGKTAFSAATALWLIAVPLMDMVRVMLYRARQGVSLLKADRNHLHHILLVQNKGNKELVLIKICTLSAFFAVVGMAMQVSIQQTAIIFFTFLAGFAVYTVRVSKINKVLQTTS